jgi:hypothetical protein
LSEDSDTIGEEAVNSRDRYCFSATVPQSSVLSIQGQNNVCLVTMGDFKMMMAHASSGSDIPAVLSSNGETGNPDDLIPQVHTVVMADSIIVNRNGGQTKRRH